MDPLACGRPGPKDRSAAVPAILELGEAEPKGNGGMCGLEEAAVYVCECLGERGVCRWDGLQSGSRLAGSQRQSLDLGGGI